MPKQLSSTTTSVIYLLRALINNDYIICTLIFLVSGLVYLSNKVTISSGDSVPSTLLALNLLENHTIHLDTFRNSYFFKIGIGYAFRESANGHLTSGYPIGTAILTFPTYLLSFLYLKLAQISIDMTDISFEPLRLLLEKIAATFITSLSAAVFYLASRLNFRRRIALLTTLIYAFATNVWITGSQGLWQHGSSNLAILIVLLCFLKANRVSARKKIILLVIAGIFAGLLPGIRPTSALFLIAAFVYAVFTYKRQSLFFLLGLSSMMISICWNLYYFSNFTGGYSGIFSSYILTLQNFLTTSLGVLGSPSRGLLIYCPIVLFACPGIYLIYQQRSNRDAQLIGCMTFASITLLLSYCFVVFWWAGDCYGPRFMTDIMPIACYLINYSLQSDPALAFFKPKTLRPKNLIFVGCLLTSIYTQAVGAFGAEAGSAWNAVPIHAGQYQHRLWQFQDNPIIRHSRAVLYNFFLDIPTKKPDYFQSLSGSIQQLHEVEKLTDQEKTIRLLTAPLTVKAGSGKVIEAILQNTGASEWFGYQFALKNSDIRVATRFFDGQNQSVSEGRLFVSGIVKPQAVGTAIGLVTFPTQPGTYRLSFELVAEGLSIFPPSPGSGPLEIQVQVQN